MVPIRLFRMQMDYINDDELEAIIQQAEDYGVSSPTSTKSTSSSLMSHTETKWRRRISG